MPYITPSRRAALESALVRIQHTLGDLGYEEGDLNYVISRLVAFYFNGCSRYKMIARVTGVLKNVSDEFTRRVVAQYEEDAIEKNGDIPEYENMPRRRTQ